MPALSPTFRARLYQGSLWLMGLAYVLAGLNHFRDAAFYLHIMPPFIPLPTVVVDLSGALEITLGVLVLTKKWRVWGAWGIIALLVAVSPVHIHMALHADLFPEFPPAGLYFRIVLQGALMAWAWVYTRERG